MWLFVQALLYQDTTLYLPQYTSKAILQLVAKYEGMRKVNNEEKKKLDEEKKKVVSWTQDPAAG